jgi:hypothetical protein
MLPRANESRAAAADMKWLAPFVSIAFVLVGCERGSSSEAGPMDEGVAKVAVFADGRITLNGNSASIEEVRATFAELAADKGVVWYYREAADAEPHPTAMLVIQAIVEARLPVSMSTKPDFSDVVSAAGSSRAR